MDAAFVTTKELHTVKRIARHDEQRGCGRQRRHPFLQVLTLTTWQMQRPPPCDGLLELEVNFSAMYVDRPSAIYDCREAASAELLGPHSDTGTS